MKLNPSPAPTALLLPPRSPEKSVAEDGLQPFYNPRRTVLLATAYQKLAAAAERIERLESRLKSLSADDGNFFS